MDVPVLWQPWVCCSGGESIIHFPPFPSMEDPSLNKRLQGKPISKILFNNTSLISDTCYHIRFDCLFQGETPMTSQVISAKLYCGQKADLWSCGVTLYALLCSHTPFADDTIQATFNRVKGLLLISSCHHFLARIHSWGTTTRVCIAIAMLPCFFALKWVPIVLPFSPVQSVNSLLFLCSRRIQAPWSTIAWCKGSPETDDHCWSKRAPHYSWDQVSQQIPQSRTKSLCGFC